MSCPRGSAASASAGHEPSRPPAVRLRQGLVLLAGALVFGLVLGSSPDRFYLIPVGLGLIYLATATARGPRGGYWATALVLLGWGTAVVWVRDGRPRPRRLGL